MTICHIDSPRLLRPIRIGPDGWQYGEPYEAFTTFAPDLPDWATAIIAAVIEIAGTSTTGTIIGLDKPVNREAWYELARAFNHERVEFVRFERIAPRGMRVGAKREKVIDIQRQLERGFKNGSTDHSR